MRENKDLTPTAEVNETNALPDEALENVSAVDVKVAINGFGHIGRLAFRQLFGNDDAKTT